MSYKLIKGGFMAATNSTSKKVETEAKKLYRSGKDQMIAGVCGGFAEYLSMDATLIRVIAVATILFGGIGLLAYLIAWIIIPLNPAHKNLDPKEKKCSTDPQLFWGVILVVLGIFLLLNRFDFFYFRFYNPWTYMWRYVWPLIIIAFGIFLLAKKPFVGGTKTVSKAGGKARLFRSKKNRMLAGICGGMGEYFNFDPSVVRIGWVLLAIVSGGLAILAYIVLIFIIPEE
jgi:phage shock protein PspC (stress-responsive transcriptional regulator)